MPKIIVKIPHLKAQKSVDLSSVKEEVSNHDGVIWTPIVSLDAVRHHRAIRKQVISEQPWGWRRLDSVYAAFLWYDFVRGQWYSRG